MSKTSSLVPFEPGRLHGGIAPLAVVIATNLASAHCTGQYLAGLAALAFALAHDTLIHRQRTGWLVPAYEQGMRYGISGM